MEEGREELNFSEWFKQPAEKRQEIKKEVIEEIEEGKMPFTGYVKMHPTTEITDEKLQILKSWAFAQADNI